MDFEWLEKRWPVIEPALFFIVLTAVVTCLATASITAKVVKTYFSGEAAAAKDRADHYKERLAELESEKTTLLQKLGAHGEDIDALKKELASRGRIHIQDEEPVNPGPNDIWITRS